MGLFGNSADRRAEKDAKQRAKNKAWHEENAKKAAVVRGASQKRNELQLEAARAAGYDIRPDGGMFGATGATKRGAKDKLVKMLGGDDKAVKKAEKLIKQEANRVAKEFGSK